MTSVVLKYQFIILFKSQTMRAAMFSPPEAALLERSVYITRTVQERRTPKQTQQSGNKPSRDA